MQWNFPETTSFVRSTFLRILHEMSVSDHACVGLLALSLVGQGRLQTSSVSRCVDQFGVWSKRLSQYAVRMDAAKINKKLHVSIEIVVAR